MSISRQRYEHLQQEVIELLQHYQNAKEEGLEMARGTFLHLRETLERLISCEEGELFPAFEKASDPSREGPTEVMRVEHRQIRMLLDDIAQKLDLGNMKTDAEQVVLHEMLATHQRQERRVLQQAIEQSWLLAPPSL